MKTNNNKKSKLEDIQAQKNSIGWAFTIILTIAFFGIGTWASGSVFMGTLGQYTLQFFILQGIVTLSTVFVANAFHNMFVHEKDDWEVAK